MSFTVPFTHRGIGLLNVVFKVSLFVNFILLRLRLLKTASKWLHS